MLTAECLAATSQFRSSPDRYMGIPAPGMSIFARVDAQCRKTSMPEHQALRVVLLPVEPVILEDRHSGQALSSGWTGERASVKVPDARACRIHHGPFPAGN